MTDQAGSRSASRKYVPLPGKIAIEEAFTLPDLPELDMVHPWQKSERYKPIIRNLPDIDGRIERMDMYGVQMEILSLSSPGLQGVPDVGRGRDLMRRSNDELGRIIAKHPGRFGGFAALAMHDAEDAAKELDRCIDDLGFHGALLNGFQNIGDLRTAAYLDEDRYRPFWKHVEDRGVPVYIHPRDFLEGQSRIIEGRPVMKASVWAYTAETAGHALRLIMSGLFDDYPKLTIILGHLGEALTFLIDRIDRRVSYVEETMMPRLKHAPSHYLRNNFYFTTSGAFDTHALQNVINVMGIERVLFSIDDPFETFEDAVDWFETAPLSPNARQMIGVDNAKRLLRIER